MVRTPRLTAWLGLAALLLVATSSAQAQLTGLWEFDNAGNLGLATVGNDLVFSGDAPTHSASLADDFANSLSGVITTAAATNANRIQATHGISPNGGGSFVNRYTIVTDIFSPVGSRDSWRTIYQTSTSNSNDGEYFIRPENNLMGVGDLGYSSSEIDETAWTRLVLSVDLTKEGGDVVAYTNGSLFYTHPGNPGVDGRFSLDPTMFFFTDNDGDNAPLNVGVLAIYGSALSAFDVQQLGGPGDPILSVFETQVLDLTVNRDDGTVMITNNTNSTQTIKGYSILSAAGSLSEPDAVFLADSDSSWIQFTAPGAVTDLSEGHLTTGTALGVGNSISLSDGAWSKYYVEDTDITFEYIDGAGVVQTGNVAFTGTTFPNPFLKGDLNFDGIVDGLDWGVYVAQLGNSFTGLSASQAYRFGDFNNDGINGHSDFVEFKNAFDAANGAGAFLAMLGGTQVPEPGSIVLLATVGIVACGYRLKRRAWSVVAAAIACVFVFAGQANAQLVGLWEFNNAGNLGLATVGNNLIFEGEVPTFSASLADDHAFSLTGVITTATPAPSNRIRADHNISPNGGGQFVNQYTIVTDIFSPVGSRNSWRTIYQTNTANANDGDYFISPADQLGVAALTYSANPIDETAWTRLAITVDLAASGNDVHTYLDGVLHHTHAPDQPLDGRHSLDPFLYLFTDEDGENFPLNVGMVAMFDGALTPFQVGQLGKAGDPIAFVPEPTLTLKVTKGSGNVRIVNESGFALAQPINFYEIVSGDGAGGDGLLTTVGWNSLSNQTGLTPGIEAVDGPDLGDTAGDSQGETWDQGGGSGVDRLTEAFLLGSTAFADGYSVNLGNVYTGGAGGAENLSFNFAFADGTLRSGLVEYVTSGAVPGDYNGDGFVNAADYALWRDTRGATVAAGTGADGSGNGTVGDEDYTYWYNRFGNPGGSGSGALAANVPEPSSLVLVVACAGLVAVGVRRRG
jgi:hypothetical protein